MKTARFHKTFWLECVALTIRESLWGCNESKDVRLGGSKCYHDGFGGQRVIDSRRAKGRFEKTKWSRWWGVRVVLQFTNGGLFGFR